jgi:hypothetical protein
VTPAPVVCPACGAAAEARDVAAGMVLCRACGALSEVGAPARPVAARAGGGEVGTPAAWPSQVRDEGDALVQRWFSCASLFLIPFALFWNGITWTVMAAVLLAPEIPLVFRLFPLVHVGVGLALAYAAAALMINRTRVEVRGGRLSTTTGPLPWPTAGRLREARPVDLSIQPKEHRVNGAPVVRWAVVATVEGGEVVVIGDLGSEAEAEAVRTWLRRRLGR